MKNGLFILLLTSLLSISCGNNNPEGAPVTNNTTTAPPAAPVASTPETAYVGKTTAEIEAQGAHYCGGHLLSGNAYDASALYTSTYAATEAACESGENHILLERSLSHDASGKANMQILAHLPVTERKPQQQHFVTELSVNGGARASYVVEYVEDGSQTVKQVGKLWLVNTATNAFEEVPVPAGFTFPHPYNGNGEDD